MKLARWAIIATALALASGCATHAPRKVRRQPATTQSLDAASTLSLDQIEPRPVLAAPLPTTQPAVAPLEAVELFAKARDAQIQNQRYTAINLLEKAIQLDPDSFELNHALGTAYMGIGGSGDRAIAALEKAARINPNDLQVQTELGRAHQARGDSVQAIERFRLAMQTDEYVAGDTLAAVVDYRLAVALQARGYDRAALECYDRLLERLEHPAHGARTAPEIGYLMTRPELVYEEIGRLCEKHEDYAQALRAYQAVAQRSASDFSARARVARMLVKLGRDKDAIAAATELVQRFRANTESIELLKEIHSQVGSGGGFVQTLRQLHRENPDDRAILFALADTLAAAGQIDEARNLLWNAVQKHDGDVEIVGRLYSLYADRDEVTDAARLIIRVTAAHPETTSELAPLFGELMRLSRKNSLRLTSLQRIDVPSEAQAAKQYWVWGVASQWGRPATARSALEQAAHAEKPFDPACRALLDTYFTREDLDDAARHAAADALIESVRSRGREDLAQELRGRNALLSRKPDQAVRALAEAARLSPRPSPDLQLQQAEAQLKNGDAPRFEQQMWKLIGDRPRFEAAYERLLVYYRENNADAQAWNLVNTWLLADPNTPSARIQHAVALVGQRRGGEALSAIRKLFEQRPDDPQVVTALILLLNAANQPQQAIDLLEAERTARPGNRIAVEALLEIYAGQNRMAEASRALDGAREAVGSDPDLLYYIAHLYSRVGQEQTTEEILQQVLDADPSHAQAGNDLGYTWADAGRNLDRAETMIRGAVHAEPDNPAYLDSLAWVLYKRGRFDEALKLLDQATEPAESADPVVLDHLGDALYRLERSNEAAAAWQRALSRVGRLGRAADRPEMKSLRLQLQSKLRQTEAGQPVNVAPVVETPPSKDQANNQQE